MAFLKVFEMGDRRVETGNLLGAGPWIQLKEVANCLFWRRAGIGGNLGMQKTIAFTIAIALTADAQNIETVRSDRHKVIRSKRPRTI